MQQDNKFVSFMKLIWPTVYKVINTVLYTVLTFLKTNIKLTIQQLFQR